MVTRAELCHPSHHLGVARLGDQASLVMTHLVFWVEHHQTLIRCGSLEHGLTAFILIHQIPSHAIATPPHLETETSW